MPSPLALHFDYMPLYCLLYSHRVLRMAFASPTFSSTVLSLSLSLKAHITPGLAPDCQEKMLSQRVLYQNRVHIDIDKRVG